jgi:hypothetical protein
LLDPVTLRGVAGEKNVRASNDRAGREAALLGAAEPAFAGTLDFWEALARRAGHDGEIFRPEPRGSRRSASTPTPPRAAAWCTGASEITIRPGGIGAIFKAWDCALAGCNSSDLQLPHRHREPAAGTGDGVLVVSDPDLDEKHGIYDLGSITFDGPSQSGQMLLVTCNYTTLDFVERTCDPFVLVTLPEPGATAGAARVRGAAIRPLRRVPLTARSPNESESSLARAHEIR